MKKKDNNWIKIGGWNLSGNLKISFKIKYTDDLQKDFEQGLLFLAQTMGIYTPDGDTKLLYPAIIQTLKDFVGDNNWDKILTEMKEKGRFSGIYWDEKKKRKRR